MPLDERTADHARQREFYTERAEGCMLLEDVIEGGTTLKEHLEGLMMMGIHNPCQRFKEYLDLITGLGMAWHMGLDREKREELEKRYNALYIGEFGGAKMGLKDLAENYSIYAIMFGALLCAIPPFTLAEPLLIAGGGASLVALRRSRRYYADTKKRKDEIFGPLHKAAECLDREIGACFLLDHFMHSRERFEQTYAGMSGKERETTGEMLYGFLAAGGIPGMDQDMLQDYLEGLPEPEGGG